MSVYEALVPVMTSNTTPEGECGASSVYSGFPAYYAFNGTTYDRTLNGRYWSAASGVSNAYVYYKFISPVTIYNFKFVSSEARGTADNNTTVVLIGSDDGTNWDDIQTYNIVAKAYTTRMVYELSVKHPKTYLYFGIKFPAWPQGSANAGEVQFYGHFGEHVNSTGNLDAIKDWLNASLYNKDELNNLLIQNNSGLQAYELTITDGSLGQMIKMIGQTSGKEYNVCLDGYISNTGAYKGLFWFTAGEHVKIFDVDSGTEILEHTLDDYIDNISLT